MGEAEFTKNETVALMHKDGAWALRKIADYIEKWELNHQESVKLLREIADEKDAQSMVVKLRDEINL